MNTEKYTRRYLDSLHTIIAVAQSELKRCDDTHFLPSAALRSHCNGVCEASSRLEAVLEESDNLDV
jgi:hypothetical protein